MVRLFLRLHAPTGQSRSIEHALRTLMRATRLETGCTDCRVWTTLADDASAADVFYEERWDSEPAMARRVRSDAFTQVLELLESAVETPQVEFDFGSVHRGLEYVEAVRRVPERS